LRNSVTISSPSTVSASEENNFNECSLSEWLAFSWLSGKPQKAAREVKWRQRKDSVASAIGWGSESWPETGFGTTRVALVDGDELVMGNEATDLMGLGSGLKRKAEGEREGGCIKDGEVVMDWIVEGCDLWQPEI